MMTHIDLDRPSRYAIDLFRNQRWVGQCVIDQQAIAQCYHVQLGPTGQDTDQILLQIQAAVQAGKDSLEWNGQRFQWRPQTGQVAPLGDHSN